MIKKDSTVYFISTRYDDSLGWGLEELLSLEVLSATVVGATKCFYVLIGEDGFEIKKKKHNVYETIDSAKKRIVEMVLEKVGLTESMIISGMQQIEQHKENIVVLKDYLKTF